MENFNKLNIAQICSIKSFLKASHNFLKWADKKKFLFFFTRNVKPGFYYSYTLGEPIYFSKEEIENGGYFNNKYLYVENNKVYYFPHIEIKMSDGKEFAKYFKTKDELLNFMNSDKLKEINWIEN